MLNLEENPASDHLREMATYFGAEFIDGTSASTMAVNNDKAHGSVSTYQIFNGLSVWAYNITFHSDFKVDLDMSAERPYYFCYNVKGYFHHRFGDREQFAKILQNQNMIVIGSPGVSAQLVFPAGERLEIAVIIVTNKAQRGIDNRSSKRIHATIDEIFQKIPKNNPYRHLSEIDSETAKYAAAISQSKEVDLVGCLLMEGAVFNMLASQLLTYYDHERGSVPHPLVSKADLSKITSLGSYIIDNLDKNYTVQELSSIFNISSRKLQVGVRQLYGDTVARYILNVRLAQAKKLFTATDSNVSEVCFKVGLSNQSHFCKVFKRRYGITPGVYRNKAAIRAESI